MYFVYIVECKDGSLYTGVTTELNRRIEEHNGAKLGAKYTKARRPVRLVYQAEFADKSTAMIEEARIKRLKRQEKLSLIRTGCVL
jgi:putative endonuclease